MNEVIWCKHKDFCSYISAFVSRMFWNNMVLILIVWFSWSTLGLVRPDEYTMVFPFPSTGGDEQGSPSSASACRHTRHAHLVVWGVEFPLNLIDLFGYYTFWEQSESGWTCYSGRGSVNYIITEQDCLDDVCLAGAADDTPPHHGVCVCARAACLYDSIAGVSLFIKRKTQEPFM